jgi:nitroimidazol reductase NimA-like FMN-containing flavoprotein (pyridoxamine 5'-phosphate oxidase superfamily)
MSSTDRIEELDTDTCLGLLSRHHFGRVAVVDDDGPVVLPVNYTVDRGSVVFRTAEGTKLDSAVHGDPVAFEVDEIDESSRSGWSVLVRGTLEEVTDGEELERLRVRPLRPCAPGERERFVRVWSRAITGRRIAVPEETPTGWFEPGRLGNRYRGVDADDLGFS